MTDHSQESIARMKPSIECWLLADRLSLDALVLLLQAASQEAHPAFWQPITGGIEPGETADQACLREVWEETGIVVEAKHLVRLEPQFNVQIDEYLTVRKTLFAATTLKEQVQLSEEHIGWQWVPFGEAKALLYWPSNHETYTAITQFLRG